MMKWSAIDQKGLLVNCFKLLRLRDPDLVIANCEDPEEMLRVMASHLGLRCLLMSHY